MKLPATLKNRKYPAFIRSHYAIKKSPVVEKCFKDLGIADYADPYTHACKTTISQYATLLKKTLKNLGYCWEELDVYGECFSVPEKEDIYTEFSKLSKKINASSIRSKGKLVMPITIHAPSYSKGKYITYFKGTSLLILLNDVARDLSDFIYYDNTTTNSYSKLIDVGVDLELSWKKNLKIVFSTHPWDIATMSMRGISSCQSWGKRQSACLIGSIIDPNAAIIYITDGKQHKNYGARMFARSVVRLTAPQNKYNIFKEYSTASEEERNKRIIFLEGAYASFSTSSAESSVFTKIFNDSLRQKAKTGGHYDSFIKTTESTQYFCGIPLTPKVKRLAEHYRSYRDSGLMYVPLVT